MTNKNYVFSRNKNSQLTFVGDFEGLYQNDADPWNQAAQSEDSEYYLSSRMRISREIKAHRPTTVLEIGTGLGYALDFFAKKWPASYTGVDISPTAINKAKTLFPNYTFNVGDICKRFSPSKVGTKFDCIILNQLLWYVLDDLDTVLGNCVRLLSDNGIFIISNAFARQQMYGNEIINGFGGAVDRFEQFSQLKMVHCSFNDDDFRNNDGLFLFKKRKFEALAANKESTNA